jgi:hypothetical protein
MPPQKKMERETGFEPATSTLARSHSTAELFPLNVIIYFLKNGRLVKSKNRSQLSVFSFQMKILVKSSSLIFKLSLHLLGVSLKPWADC